MDVKVRCTYQGRNQEFSTDGALPGTGGTVYSTNSFQKNFEKCIYNLQKKYNFLKIFQLNLNSF